MATEKVDPSTSLDPSRGEPVAGVLFVLRVTEGPSAGLSHVLDGIGEGRILLGQSAVCTVRLDDPAVSRRHLALRRETNAWRLEDLGSTNGTRVNGVAVKECFLTGGELVALGRSTFRLTRAGRSPVPLDAEEAGGFGRFVGESPELRRQYARWRALAESSLPLLIEGETGTGKELLAEVLHEAGPRASRPLVVLACAGRTDAELVAALCGSEHDCQIVAGAFEQAQGGTLVLDEPADLGPGAQARLSTVLERRAVTRAGGNEPIALDVRLVTTSRRDLDHEVQEGRFREELLYRLAGATIEIPPLRRRASDIALLVRHFWTQLGGAGHPPEELIRQSAERELGGNARELLHLVAESLAIGPAEAKQRLSSPPPALPDAPPATATDFAERIIQKKIPYALARHELLREFEVRYVEHMLAEHGGQVTRAASASGLARRYFQILKSRGR